MKILAQTLYQLAYTEQGPRHEQRHRPALLEKIVVVLCLGWTVIWIYRTVLTPIFPEIQQTIGAHSNAEMGLIASFYFFAYTGMQIGGHLVDKFGKKVVLIPGFCLFIIATLLIGNATSLTMVYAGSLLAGMGCGSYYGSAYSCRRRISRWNAVAWRPR